MVENVQLANNYANLKHTHFAVANATTQLRLQKECAFPTQQKTKKLPDL
jgi:hypothetical protein